MSWRATCELAGKSGAGNKSTCLGGGRPWLRHAPCEDHGMMPSKVLARSGQLSEGSACLLA
eukprot:2868954-Rhodomonas_salina.2